MRDNKIRCFKSIISIILMVNIFINLFGASYIFPQNNNINKENGVKQINNSLKDDIECGLDNSVETEVVSVKTEEKNLNVKESIDEILQLQESDSFRDGVNINENVVMFIVSQFRKVGGKLNYLNDKDRLYKELGLKNIKYVSEVLNEEKDGEMEFYVTYKAEVTRDIWEIVDKLNAREDIIGAEPCYTYKTEENSNIKIPNYYDNPYMQMQWYIDEMGMEANWNEMKKNGFYPGKDVVIAMIDTGVQTSHEALKDALWTNTKEIPGNGIDDDGNGYVDDYYGVNVINPNAKVDDDNGHGTNMASIIVMQGVGGKSGAGLAYGAKVMAIKAADSKGEFYQDSVVKAINYAVKMKADIINMSFGGERSVVIEVAVKNAYRKGHILIAAAGNEGAPTSDSMKAFNNRYENADNYPAASPYVVGVMAYNQNNRLCSFSNWDYKKGNNIEYELIAPGASIYCADIGENQYAFTSGTSAATAVVSAMAANYRSIYRSKTKYNNKFIINKLKSNKYVAYTDINGKNHQFTKLNTDLASAANTIGKLNLALCTVKSQFSKYVYTGEEIKPNITVYYGKAKLQEGVHYDVEYRYNTYIGKCEITITAVTGKSYGSKTTTVDIVPQEIEEFKASLVQEDEDTYEKNNNKVRLSWQTDRMCEGYNIFRYDTNLKRYVLIKKIEGYNTSEYIDEGLEQGTNYSYLISGYKNHSGITYNGKLSNKVVICTNIGKPVLKYSSNSSTKITIGWNRVTGATDYEIFKYDRENFKYKKIATTKANKTYFIDTGLEPLKKYYYVVRAIRNNGDCMQGDYSDKLEAYTGPDKVENFNLSTEGNKKMLLSWGQVQNVSGYQIYVSNKVNGKYTLISNIKPMYIKVRVIHVPKGQVFYFKVRAFKKINGKYIYGDFSETKFSKSF